MENDKTTTKEGLGIVLGSLVVISLLSVIYAFHKTTLTAKRKRTPEEVNAMQMKEQLEQLERIISEKESAIAALTRPN